MLDQMEGVATQPPRAGQVTRPTQPCHVAVVGGLQPLPLQQWSGGVSALPLDVHVRVVTDHDVGGLQQVRGQRWRQEIEQRYQHVDV